MLVDCLTRKLSFQTSTDVQRLINNLFSPRP